jgi:hypothetical protein
MVKFVIKDVVKLGLLKFPELVHRPSFINLFHVTSCQENSLKSLFNHHTNIMTGLYGKTNLEGAQADMIIDAIGDLLVAKYKAQTVTLMKQVASLTCI